MEETKANKLISTAMNIIMHAGDARSLATQALTEAKIFEFDNASKLLIQANDAMIIAHQSQTAVIQVEASGDTFEPTIFFIHAQDTIMTVMSEIRLIKELIQVIKMIKE